MDFRWTMIVPAVGVCVLSLAAAPQAARPQAAPPQACQLARNMFEGRWNITLTPDDDTRQAGEKEFKDTLIFKGGIFASTAFEKRGFEPSVYEQDNRAGSIGGFDCAQTSKTGQGKTQWSGSITGSQVQGNLVWTKKDGTAVNFSYHGSKE